VGSVTDKNGTVEIEPRTDEEWAAVRNSAYVVAEAGNLLMMTSRAKDSGDWMKLSEALVDVGQRAIRAAESRDATAVFDVGAEVYDACVACHAKYALPLMRPNAAGRPGA
jgi:rRNA maturation endonuclease Nob1